MSSSLRLATTSFSERLERHKNHDRLGVHSFHRYFGKLIPAIPSAAVEEFTQEGDVVLDPFCGSGTTLVESLVRKREVIGIDVNPLSVLISRVKTTPMNAEVLKAVAEEVVEIASELLEAEKLDPPYCVNIHHWYRPKVIRQLAALHSAADKISDACCRDFIKATLSSINRNVSNADPQHVFPGYSKRLRQLDREKGRRLDVFETFLNGAIKRAGYIEELAEVCGNESSARVIHGHADATGLPDASVDMIVTNPPYISSVRYLETLKLEMSWAGFITSADQYRDIDRLQFGSERFSMDEADSFHISGVRQVDMISRELFDAGQQKMSLTVSTYFRRMLAALDEWNRVLKNGGKLIFKISPSKVRGEIVPTPKILQKQLLRKGYEVVEEFEDDYNQNSRSLLTARNYYSGRMDSDIIQVLVKL